MPKPGGDWNGFLTVFLEPFSLKRHVGGSSAQAKAVPTEGKNTEAERSGMPEGEQRSTTASRSL
jgi:hypothetical protein